MRDFSDFSTAEIEKIAKEASDRAREKAFAAGSEIASQDLETGELYLERRNENGEIVRRPMPDGYIDTLKTETSKK